MNRFLTGGLERAFWLYVLVAICISLRGIKVGFFNLRNKILTVFYYVIFTDSTVQGEGFR